MGQTVLKDLAEVSWGEVDLESERRCRGLEDLHTRGQPEAPGCTAPSGGEHSLWEPGRYYTGQYSSMLSGSFFFI